MTAAEPATKPRRRFPFLVQYFKRSGKFYADAIAFFECQVLSEEASLAYSHDAIDQLRELLNGTKLPGLSEARTSPGWDGPVFLEQAVLREGRPLDSDLPSDYFADGVPHLLLPRVQVTAFVEGGVVTAARATALVDFSVYDQDEAESTLSDEEQDSDPALIAYHDLPYAIY